MAWTPPPGWPPPPTPGWSPPAGWQPDPSWGPPPEDWNFWPVDQTQPQPQPPTGWPYPQGAMPAYASGPYTPAPPPPPTPRMRSGSIVVIVGAVLAMVGAFGTWIRVDIGFGETVRGSGVSGGRDGPFVIGMALVVLVIAICRLAGVRVPAWLTWLAIADAALLVVVGIADTADVHHRVHQARELVATVSGGVGWGLWLALIGGVILLAGTIMSIDTGRRAQAPWPSYSGQPSAPP